METDIYKGKDNTNINKMSAGVRIEGELLGFETSFYMDSNKNVAALIELDNDDLTKFFSLFETSTANSLKKYAQDFGKVNGSVLVWFEPDESWYVCLKDAKKRFVLYTGKQGQLILFDYKTEQLKEYHNMGAVFFDQMLDFLGIKNLLFAYRKGSPNSKRLRMILSKYNLSIPDNFSVQENDDFFLYAELSVSDISAGALKSVLQSDLFKLSNLKLYIDISSEGARFFLVLPNIKTNIINSKNLSIEICAGELVSFKLNGVFSFCALENTEFEFDALFSDEKIEISAASLPEQVYQIEKTAIVITDIALSVGLTKAGIEFGLIAGAEIRKLRLFCAVHLVVVEEGTPLPDLIAIALSELSLSCICENIIGLNDAALGGLDVISIVPFEINNTRSVCQKENWSVEDVMDLINSSGLPETFYVTEQDIILEPQEEGLASLNVLDKKRMLHYSISEDGELSFLPQCYFAYENVTLGSYVFQKGIFFCGELRFLNKKFKIMCCALDGQGMIGFAQISKLDLGIIKLTASERSKSFENPVTSDPNSMVSILVGDDSEDNAIIYVSISRDKYSLYLDGCLELYSLYAFDTQIIFSDGYISIYEKYEIEGLYSTTIQLSVNYSSFLKGDFSFAIIFDAEPLYEKLDGLRDYVNKLAEDIKKKTQDINKQLDRAQDNVYSLQKQIDGLNKDIADSKKVIQAAKWWQVWIVTKESAKILASESAIAALNLSIGVAIAALELAKAAVSAAGWIGEEVLSAVDQVISGVMKAFFIRKLQFSIGDNLSNDDIKNEKHITGILESTVIGKDVSGNFDVSLSDLKKSVKNVIESAIKGLISDNFSDAKHADNDNINCQNNVEAGNAREDNASFDKYSDLPHSHLMLKYSGPESLNSMSLFAQEGTDRLESGGKMVQKLVQTYVDKMGEECPEFISMVKEYKDVVNTESLHVARVIESVSETTKILADKISERVNLVRKSDILVPDDELAIMEQSLNKYRKYTEPSIAESLMVKNRMQSLAASIDSDEGKNRLKKLKKERGINAERSAGLYMLENRNYDELYDSIKKIVLDSFPKGEKSNFIHLGNEPEFYRALNDSRRESGCTFVNEELSRRRVKEKNINWADEYRVRL